MTERYEKLIDRFKAIDEEGTIYTINCFQEYMRTESFNGTSVVKGLKRFETSGFDHVNRIDDNTFEIISTETIVKKVVD